MRTLDPSSQKSTFLTWYSSVGGEGITASRVPVKELKQAQMRKEVYMRT